MAKPLIVLGDKTSHGGTVISGSPSTPRRRASRPGPMNETAPAGRHVAPRRRQFQGGN